jgi:hypothetical protein
MENSEIKQTPNQTALAKIDKQIREQQYNKLSSTKAGEWTSTRSATINPGYRR